MGHDPEETGTASPAPAVLLGLIVAFILADIFFMPVIGLFMGDSGGPTPTPSPSPSPITATRDLGPQTLVAVWNGNLVACASLDTTGRPDGCVRRDHVSETWSALGFELLDEFRAQASVEDLAQKQACLPSSPSTCFRVIADGLGVERTGDAGRTWAIEWTVAKVDAIARLGWEADDERALVSLAIAVAERNGVYEVGVVSGEAGLAFRDRAGTWDIGVLAERPLESEPGGNDAPSS